MLVPLFIYSIQWPIRWSVYPLSAGAVAERANAIRDLIIAANKQNNACCAVAVFISFLPNTTGGQTTPFS